MQSKDRLFADFSSVVCEHWLKMGGGKRKLDLENTEEDAPAVKRANLDRFNAEERLMRRKPKNRSAAQTARNKKTQLAGAEARLQGSLEASAELVKTNTKLQMENASLHIQNSDLQTRLFPPCTSMDDGKWRTDAQKKFFQSPDLVSQLLPFLDLSSMLVLASILPLARQLLQRKFIWRGFIRRSLQDLDNNGTKVNEGDLTKVEQLVKILQKLESPEPLLEDLLDFICETFETDADDESGAVKLSCSRHILHKVNKQGFQLLELVEGKMGTCLQCVIRFSDNEVVTYHSNEQSVFVEALLARVQRQKTQQIWKVEVNEVSLSSRHCLNATLLRMSETFETENLDLTDFDAEDWSWFAQLVQQKKIRDGDLSIEHMTCDSKDIVKAKIEDLKKVWEAIDDCLSICYPDDVYKNISRTCGDNGVHFDEDCPFRDEPDADLTECGWRRLQEALRVEQEFCA